MEGDSVEAALNPQDQSIHDECSAPIQGADLTDEVTCTDGPTSNIRPSTINDTPDPLALAVSITLERTFVVKETCLDKLLQCFLCIWCHKPTDTITKCEEEDGSLLVAVLCPTGHEILRWSASQPEQIKFQRALTRNDSTGPVLKVLQDVPVGDTSRVNDPPCHDEVSGNRMLKIDQETQTVGDQGGSSVGETLTSAYPVATRKGNRKKKPIDCGTVSHLRNMQHLIMISTAPYIHPDSSPGQTPKGETVSKNASVVDGDSAIPGGGLRKRSRRQAPLKENLPEGIGGPTAGRVDGARRGKEQPRGRPDIVAGMTVGDSRKEDTEASEEGKGRVIGHQATREEPDKTVGTAAIGDSKKEGKEASEEAEIALKKQKTCRFCGRLLSSVYRRKIHERQHTGEKPFKCKVCPKEFKSRESLAAHTVVHTGEKPFQCSKCEMRFSTRHFLRCHLPDHGSRSSIQCSYCGKEFRSSNNVKRHMVNHHGHETVHHCKTCQERFHTKEEFLKHAKNHRREWAREVGVGFEESSDDEDWAAGCANSTVDGLIEEEGGSAEAREPVKNVETETTNNEASGNGERTAQKSDNRRLEFKCRYCEETFPNVEQRTNHHSFHTKDLLHSCSQCDMKFSGPQARQAHEELHLIKPHRCKFCNEPFSFQEVCEEHEMTCPCIRRNRCQYCRKLFATWKQCKAHMDAHPKARPHKCNICGKGFKRKFDVKKHMVVHEEGMNHLCQLCGKAFKAREHLMTHLRVHRATRIFKCSYCDKMFKSKYCRKIHEKSHRGEKRYKCNYCDNRFLTLIARTHHHRIHEGAFPYQCSYCQRPFRHRSSLLRHIRTHTGEMPYPCRFCERRFRDLRASRIHESKHTGVRPHVCSFCGKSFAAKGHLLRHERIHTGKKQMKCRYCDEHFMYSQSRKNHEKKFHAEEVTRDEAMAQVGPILRQVL